MFEYFQFIVICSILISNFKIIKMAELNLFCHLSMFRASIHMVPALYPYIFQSLYTFVSPRSLSPVKYIL